MKNFHPISLKLKPENLVGEHKLMLTQTQLNKLNKAKSKRKGIVLKFSQNQIKKTGGSLFSLIPTLAKAALPTAAKALGLAGLSFGAEKALKKIFGSGGIPPGAVELYDLVGKLSPVQKKINQKCSCGTRFRWKWPKRRISWVACILGNSSCHFVGQESSWKRNEASTKWKRNEASTKWKRNEIATSNCWILGQKKIRGCTLE